MIYKKYMFHNKFDVRSSLLNVTYGFKSIQKNAYAKKKKGFPS